MNAFRDLPTPIPPEEPIAPHDTLNITPQRWEQLSRELLRRNNEFIPETNLRQETRTQMLTAEQITLDSAPPGGGALAERKEVCGINLSRHGLSVLHRGQLAPGSACICWLPSLGRPLLPQPGTLQWCEQIDGDLYHSGIHFPVSIDVEIILGPH